MFQGLNVQRGGCGGYVEFLQKHPKTHFWTPFSLSPLFLRYPISVICNSLQESGRVVTVGDCGVSYGDREKMGKLRHTSKLPHWLVMNMLIYNSHIHPCPISLNSMSAEVQSQIVVVLNYQNRNYYTNWRTLIVSSIQPPKLGWIWLLNQWGVRYGLYELTATFEPKGQAWINN